MTLFDHTRLINTVCHIECDDDDALSCLVNTILRCRCRSNIYQIVMVEAVIQNVLENAKKCNTDKKLSFQNGAVQS